MIFFLLNSHNIFFLNSRNILHFNFHNTFFLNFHKKSFLLNSHNTFFFTPTTKNTTAIACKTTSTTKPPPISNAVSTCLVGEKCLFVRAVTEILYSPSKAAELRTILRKLPSETTSTKNTPEKK